MAEHTVNDKHTALFLQLVLTFQSAAWQQMGKVKNPFTDKVERNLEQARHSIDMLEMFRAKSQGNLTEDEKSFLDRTISELQLNFVAEIDKMEPEPQEKPEEKPKPTEKKAAEKPKAAAVSKKKTPKKKPAQTTKKKSPKKEKSK